MEIIMAKNIKKSFKYTAYGMLTTCAVIFGSSYEVRASDIVEKGAILFNAILFVLLGILPKILKLKCSALQDKNLMILWKMLFKL